MRETLEDIVNKLNEKAYRNEEHVRLSLVSRILQELDWDIWNPNEVNSEFPVVPNEDQSRVDLALFLTPYVPSVFVEIKAVGKLEGNIGHIEKQLRDYNRNNTALFSVISDGRKWRFYFSQTGGEFSQKCFRTLDLIEDDIEDVELTLHTFLSKSEIDNGKAKVAAKGYLRLNQKQRAMEEILSKARRMVSEPPYPTLPQAIVQLVPKAQFLISEEEATQFLNKFDTKKPPIEPPAKKSIEKLTEKTRIVKPKKGKSIDEHISGVSKELRALFSEINERILQISDEIEQYTTNAEIIYKTSLNFAYVALQKRKNALRILLRSAIGQIRDPSHLTEEIPKTHGYGKITHQMHISPKKDHDEKYLDDIMDIIRQAYTATQIRNKQKPIKKLKRRSKDYPLRIQTDRS